MRDEFCTSGLSIMPQSRTALIRIESLTGDAQTCVFVVVVAAVMYFAFPFLPSLCLMHCPSNTPLTLWGKRYWVSCVLTSRHIQGNGKQQGFCSRAKFARRLLHCSGSLGVSGNLGVSQIDLEVLKEGWEGHKAVFGVKCKLLKMVQSNICLGVCLNQHCEKWKFNDPL